MMSTFATILGIVSTMGALLAPSLSLPLQTTSDSGASLSSTSTNIRSYMMELYEQLSSENTRPPQSYNTIRSLESIPSACIDNLVYQFAFDISGITEEEKVLKSTLRVYFENSGSFVASTKDSILASLGHGNGTAITSKTLDGTATQWVEFEVGSSMDSWSALDAPLIFTIQLDYLRESGPHTNIRCDDQTYSLVTDSPLDLNQRPLLVVYTDQTDLDLVKGLEAAMEETLTHRMTDTKRSTRSATVPTCGRTTDIMVTKEWLNTIFHRFSFEMLQPNNMELNMCGGDCSNTLSLSPTHAALLSTYVANGAFDFEQSKFQKCCIPIEYSAITIVTRDLVTGYPKIQILENATARRCGCIYTYNF